MNAPHPGELLVMALKAVGVSQIELARLTGLSAKHVNQFCRGHANISPRTAILFEEVLGVEAGHWVRLQGAYDLALARKARRDELKARPVQRRRFRKAQQARQEAWIEQVAPTWLNAGGSGDA